MCFSVLIMLINFLNDSLNKVFILQFYFILPSLICGGGAMIAWPLGPVCKVSWVLPSRGMVFYAVVFLPWESFLFFCFE